MKFFSNIFILFLFFFEFAMGQIPGTPNLSSQLQKPSVYTLSYTFPNLTTANVTAQVINSRQNRIEDCGILWGSSIPTITSHLGKTVNGKRNGGPFTHTATSLPLDVDTIYFVAYATTNKGKTQYGKVLTLPRTVQSPFTGKVWLAFNLGATSMPVSSSPTPDFTSYGNLYQWGRTSDGHEIAQPTKSAQTTTLAADYTNTTSSFITNSSGTQNWLTNDNPNLWQGILGLNNPCPNRYRVPALTEFSDEIINFSSQNISGAFNSFLKLPVTGSRDNSGTVIGYSTHDIGRYWTSSINGTNSRPIYLTASSITQPTDLSSSARVNGYAVRCIRGEISSGGTAIVTAYTSGTSAGTMTASVPVSGVTQTISATVSKIGDYYIAAIANGVTFSAQGIFSQTGNQDIVLTASGTPELGTPPGSSISYTLNTLPNSTFTRTVQGWTTNGTAEVSSYSQISSNRTLYAGVPVSEVKQTFAANVITPGSYNITAINNSLTYKARGTFAVIGNQNFELTASGTPINTGTFTFNSNTTPSATFTNTFIDLSTNGTAVVSGYSPSSSTGTIIVGQSVSNVSQTFIANVTTAGTYTITTNTANGLTFAANGVFANTGAQTVTLIASGTPIATGTITLTSNTTPSITFTRKIISTSTNGTAVITGWSIAEGSNGIMTAGVPIVFGSINQRFNLNTSVAGDYNISTQPVNGVTFSGIGNLIAGSTTLDLYASGTPTATGFYGYTTNTSLPDLYFYRNVYDKSTNGTGAVSSYALKSSVGTLYVGGAENGAVREIITPDVISYSGTDYHYNITTNTANGITFSARGSWGGGSKDIELVASGTPITTGTFTYTINTNPGVTFSRTTEIGEPSSNGTAIISSISQNGAYTQQTSGINLPYLDYFNQYLINVSKAGTYNISASANGTTYNSNGYLGVGNNQSYKFYGVGTPTNMGSHTYVLNVSGVTGNSSVNRTTLGHPSTNGNGIITSYNSSSSSGTMTSGIPVSGVTQTYNVTVTRLGSYSISVTVDGVTFAANGIFTITGTQDIVFTASGTPTSSGSKAFTLNVTIAGNKTFNRTVNTPDVSTNGSAIVSGYSLSSSAGTMTVGVPTSGVTQTIIANVTTAGSYRINTNTANGVTFAASGTFTGTGNQNITLIASGTPTAISATDNYTLNTTPSVSFTRATVINPSSNGTANISSFTLTSREGTMTAGVPVSGVTQRFTANVTTVGTYNISTAAINGVTFAGSGTFTGTGNQNITLTATGTPTVSSGLTPFNFTLNTTPSATFTRTTNDLSTNGTADVSTYTTGNSAGTMTALIPVSGVTQTIYADVTTAGTYTITIPATNGVIFAANGTFNNIGVQDIVLTASGTPTIAGTFTYTSNTTPIASFTRATVINPSSNGTANITSYTLSSQAGTMTVGVPVSGVTQRFTANVTTAGSYSITTNTVNGVKFAGSAASLGTGPQNITLTASGTPTAIAESSEFILNTTPSATFTRSIVVNPSSNGTAYVESYTKSNSAGIMTVGVPVSDVTQTMIANVTTAGSYSITTTTVNGVTFAGSGTYLNTGNQEITLTASGTPINPNISTFTLNTLSATFTRTIIDLSSNGTAKITGYTLGTTSGTMTVGVPVSGVTQNINALVSNSISGSYDISTNTVNGVTFTAKGNVNTGTGNKIITLTATGTPTAISASNNFIINTTPSFTFTRTTIAHPSTNGSAIVSDYTSSSSAGTMTVEVPVSDVTQTMIANVTTAGTYAITIPATNGVIFAASGTFTNTGVQDIVLTGTGTPTAIGNSTYTLNTTPNTSFTRTTVVHPSSGGTAKITSYTLSSQAGTMTAGVPVSGVTQTIIANVTTAGSYSITTNTVNGVTFAGSAASLAIGTTRTIILTATGTPTVSSGLTPFGFTLNTTPSATFTRTTNDLSTNGTADVSTYTIGNSAGTMTASIPVSGVTQTINADVTTAGTYTITIPATNGVIFAASGTFTSTGVQDIVLTGTGTPTDAGTFTYTSNTTPSASFTRTTVVNPSSGGTAIISLFTPTTQAGTMTAGVPVSGVTQRFTANVTTVGTYNISTAAINGVTFAASGTFTGTGNQPITLTATGTPTVSSGLTPFNFTLNTTPSATFTRTTNDVSTNGTATVSEISLSSSEGAMTEGLLVSGVKQTFIANVTTAGTYTITTSIANGVKFAASGTFTNTGVQDIVLIGTGTPTDAGTFTYTANTTPSAPFTRTTDINNISNETAVIKFVSLGATSGTMKVGVPITGITVQKTIFVTVTSLGTFNISTNTVNGVTFSRSGNRTSLGTGQDVKLTASGTPTAAGTFNITTNTIPAITFSITISP